MSSLEFEPLSLADVITAMREENNMTFTPREPKDPFKALRKRETPEPLQAFAITWMAKLPRNAQPRETGMQYPRIVNKLAALWHTSEGAGGYLRELLIDRRGTRKGFPTPVAQELQALRTYLTVQAARSQKDAWSTERFFRG